MTTVSSAVSISLWYTILQRKDALFDLMGWHRSHAVFTRSWKLLYSRWIFSIYEALVWQKGFTHERLMAIYQTTSPNRTNRISRRSYAWPRLWGTGIQKSKEIKPNQWASKTIGSKARKWEVILFRGQLGITVIGHECTGAWALSSRSNSWKATPNL